MNIDRALKSYKSVCKVPQVFSGRLLERGNRAVINVRQRNLSLQDFENYQLTISFEESTNSWVIGQPVPTGSSIVSVSPSGKRQISLLDSLNENKQQILSVSLKPCEKYFIFITWTSFGKKIG